MSAVAPSFHLYLPQMRLPVDAIVERAVAAEAAGFEGIAFMDHLAPPLALDQPMWDAMAVATWALAHTTTLQVGHLVLCDAFRHPAVLAREVTTLDHASGGRFELGIGWGSVPTEFTTFGVAPTEPRERVARLGESLAILRGLWSGEPVDHDGEHFQLAGAQQRPAGKQHRPIRRRREDDAAESGKHQHGDNGAARAEAIEEEAAGNLHGRETEEERAGQRAQGTGADRQVAHQVEADRDVGGSEEMAGHIGRRQGRDDDQAPTGD